MFEAIKAMIHRKSLIRQMNNLVSVQGEEGNWNYDPYMHGLFNGMEMFLSLTENRTPNFRTMEDKYIFETLVGPETIDMTALKEVI